MGKDAPSSAMSALSRAAMTTKTATGMLRSNTILSPHVCIAVVVILHGEGTHADPENAICRGGKELAAKEERMISTPPRFTSVVVVHFDEGGNGDC